jgi:hypothetical protein
MFRPIFIEIALFITPFALYVLFLWVTKQEGVLANWPIMHVLGLLVVSFLMVIVGFLVFAQWGAVPPGSTYIPAHIEDGKLVPAETKPAPAKH